MNEGTQRRFLKASEVRLLKQLFDPKDWEGRLASALETLATEQEPILKAHWEANGFPTKYIYNGCDETPFPSEVYNDLYETAAHPERYGHAAQMASLRASLTTVKDILRSHPRLSRALGRTVGIEDFLIGILGGSSGTCLNRLIVGQMARRDALPVDSFRQSIAELNSLLRLSHGGQLFPPASNLDQGYDVELFQGAHIKSCVDLGEGYLLMPFSQLSEYIDAEWIDDVAPDQVRYRDFSCVCAIVHPFRWRPELLPRNTLSSHRIREQPLLFRRYAAEFMDLLSVSLEAPVTWIMTLEGCVSRIASDLLGKIHDKGSYQRGRPVAHRYDRFKQMDVADAQLIECAKRIFANRRETSYPEFAPIIRRLAEALARDGAYAAEDRVLDLAVVFERIFKPRDRGISDFLQDAVADALGSDEISRARLRLDMKHFYDVRSAVIHGPVNEKKKRLRAEMTGAYKNGFEIARQCVWSKLE